MIDLDEWRVCGRIHGFDSVAPVAGAQPIRMMATSTHDDTSGLYDERGARVHEPFPSGLHVLQAVAHPDGVGLLALVAVWGPAEDDLEAALMGESDEEEAFLGQHLDYCINFELGCRKAFFVDEPLAWLLGHTSLDIEGRALRLPFPCFALVFTDRATLELAGSLAHGERPQIVTAYVIRAPAPRGTAGLRLHFVLDARGGAWPQVLMRELRFADDDDLDAILASAGEARALVHLILNAVLYATSANVPWPIAPSPIRALEAAARGRGKAKQARVAHRAQELGRQYSDEDVFFLPGRIPISQLRALQQVDSGPKGAALMARFMVRGHWRRAARGWADQRVRWIEPYWKGPELGPITEKEYRLKI